MLIRSSNNLQSCSGMVLFLLNFYRIHADTYIYIEMHIIAAHTNPCRLDGKYRYRIISVKWARIMKMYCASASTISAIKCEIMFVVFILTDAPTWNRSILGISMLLKNFVAIAQTKLGFYDTKMWMCFSCFVVWCKSIFTFVVLNCILGSVKYISVFCHCWKLNV